MLAGALAELAQRHPLVFLHVLARDLGDEDLIELIGDDARHAAAKRLAPCGIAKLGFTLRGAAGGCVAPRLAFIEQVPVDEGERHPGVAGDGLPIDRQPALAATLEPLDLPAMHVRMRIARLHDVVKHWPPALLGKLLEVIEIVHRIGAHERHLDEALVATAEHARQRQARFVGHQVGHHRGAVKIALHACGTVGIEALRGPSAGAGVHRLVEQAANLARLFLGGRPRLGRFQTHHPREQRRDRNVRQDVHRLGTARDTVEKFGKRGPIPRHPGLHRGVRNRFDARHREHRALAALGTHRGEAEAAVADNDRGDAVPARDGAVRIPEQLAS